MRTASERESHIKGITFGRHDLSLLSCGLLFLEDLAQNYGVMGLSAGVTISLIIIWLFMVGHQLREKWVEWRSPKWRD
jgi:hypothetical protein